MSLVYIHGPAKSGKSTIANALRNDAIAHKRGALLLDEQQTGAPRPLVEKLLRGVALPAEPPADLAALPWKREPMVIVVGAAGAAKLAEIEAVLPGFTALMGSVFTVETGARR